MGGYGSGRHNSYKAKVTVENCLKLDLNYLQRKTLLRAGTMGILNWSRGGEVCSSISFHVKNASYNDGLLLVLNYTATIQYEQTPVEEEICIINTHAYFGNYRYWMICPLCSRGDRLSKLYLPSGAKYFGCRKCYDLTYTSCNESHRFDRCYALIGARTGLTRKQVKAGLKRGDIDPGEYLLDFL